MIPRHQGGFAIVSAIFILVVLAALGAFMVSISTNQHIGSALDVQGAKAYQAARAGMEWGLYRQMRDGACVASQTFVPPAPGLADFTVTVTCASAAPGVNGGPAVYTLRATACNQPTGACPNTTTANGLYVERRVEVTF